MLSFSINVEKEKPLILKDILDVNYIYKLFYSKFAYDVINLNHIYDDLPKNLFNQINVEDYLTLDIQVLGSCKKDT